MNQTNQLVPSYHTIRVSNAEKSGKEKNEMKE